ncbi:hypothetical protein [Methylocystis sp. H62]|jgi:hypothetical protein|uniref:hypothetical protein n=1 Tax=Methylocystis sp. H62 TaxID=2785789 RepID=UPI001AEDA27B|nr:hypothetical protein [Methylocystis sp. H62]
MSHDMRDWLGFAFTTASFFIALYQLWNSKSRRRQCRRVRFRSFEGWGMKWSSYDERDDRQS